MLESTSSARIALTTTASLEEANRLGRPIPLPFFMLVWMSLKNLFASRARREGLKRFAAYVLLVPKS